MQPLQIPEICKESEDFCLGSEYLHTVQIYFGFPHYCIICCMESDPKYKDYNERLQNQVPVGFTLPGDDFLYKYDQHGGWYDKQGKYFNNNAVRCQPPYESESEEDEEVTEQQEGKTLTKNMDSGNVRAQTIRQLTTIVDSYPEEELVSIQVQDQKESLTDKDLNQILPNQKVEFKSLTTAVPKDLAHKLIAFQGKKVKGSTLYFYVRLHNSIPKSVKTTLKQIQFVSELEQVGLNRNVDFANVQADANGYSVELTPRAIELLKSHKTIQLAEA